MPDPSSEAATGGPPLERAIARGRDWYATEYVCRAGPGDRAFEERHEHFTIAAVLEGTFNYRTGSASALLHPGALLLGNLGRCFECGHEHSRGDRCVALQLAPEYFREVAASAARSSRFMFPTAMLPAGNRALPWLTRLEAEAQATAAGQLAIDETVPQLVEAVVAAAAGTAPSTARASPRDERRINDVVRQIELRFSDALDLDGLAAMAAMSKYHFLRTFRRLVGVTPYQFILSQRMRRAAVRLAASREPITAIAYEAGFGDLSTFNARFRGLFGMSPGRFRGRNLTP